MLLQEPPRSPADLYFSLFGIPVRVSPWFWLIGLLWGTMASGSKLLVLAAWMVAFFVSILLHEVGHSLAIMAFGHRPSITLYGFGGLAAYDPSYGPRLGALKRIVISFAGPLAGFILAGLVFVLDFAARASGRELSLSLDALVWFLLFINIFWGVLNLMPVFPLDGGQIAREALCVVSPARGVSWSLHLSIAVAVGLALVAAAVLHQWFMALLFAGLAMGNYQALQQHRAERYW